jgi:hypothetical protein
LHDGNAADLAVSRHKKMYIRQVKYRNLAKPYINVL